MFAECILSGTRQIRSLPSAALKTLGKKKHSVKRRFAECKKKHSAKMGFAKHSAKMGFAECFFYTRQRSKIFFLRKKEKKKMKKKLYRVPRFRTLGKEIKSFFLERRRRKKMKKISFFGSNQFTI